MLVGVFGGSCRHAESAAVHRCRWRCGKTRQQHDSERLIVDLAGAGSDPSAARPSVEPYLHGATGRWPRTTYPGPTVELVPVSSLDNRVLSRARRVGQPAPLLVGWEGLLHPQPWVRSGGAVQLRCGPATQSEQLRRAVAELRSIGTAVESFAVDNNVYPGPAVPIDAVLRIVADFEPLYVRVLPEVDPWGNPYHFWSDTQHYGAVSFGTAGISDYPYALGAGPSLRRCTTKPPRGSDRIWFSTTARP